MFFFVFFFLGDTNLVHFNKSFHSSQDPWDWYICLHLVDIYGKRR